MSEFNQDKIADKFLLQKTNGFFLDIGSSYYKKWNNSYFFEKERNYRGVAIELNPEFCEGWEENRPNTILINEDATKINYKEILEKANAPSHIDFLSIDIDPNTATFEALLNVLKTNYTFGVIAFEVDYGGDLQYKDRFSVRDPSRALLVAKDYILTKEIYARPNYHVDDIWVHKSIYNYDIEKSL